jgi:hypothetical protein
MVEAATSGPGRVHQHAVEHLAPGLVGVEPLVKEVPQEPPALGHAERDGARDRELRARVVAGPGDEVADGGQADTDDDRVASAVDQLVHLAGLETPVQLDPRRVVDGPAVLDAREAPALARHDLPGPQPGRPHGEHVVGMPGIGHGIRDMVAMGERQRARRPLDRPVAPHEALEWPAVAARDRRPQAHQPGLSRDVELPADPDEREAQARQQAIAEVGVGHGIEPPGGPVEVRQEGLAAAVADLEQRRRSPLGRPPWPQHHEVGSGLDPPARVAGRTVEVDDDRVDRKRRIELQLDPAAELLVLAPQHFLARGDHHLPHLGAGHARGGEEDEERRQRRAERTSGHRGT